jgi:hypothetical protein
MARIVMVIKCNSQMSPIVLHVAACIGVIVGVIPSAYVLGLGKEADTMSCPVEQFDRSCFEPSDSYTGFLNVAVYFSFPENYYLPGHKSASNLHYVSLRYRPEQPICLSVPRKGT